MCSLLKLDVGYETNLGRCNKLVSVSFKMRISLCPHCVISVSDASERRYVYFFEILA